MLHPAMRHVLGIGDDLMAGIQRGEKEALSAFSQRLTSQMPGNMTADVKGVEDIIELRKGGRSRETLNFTSDIRNSNTVSRNVETTSTEIHRDMMQHSPEYRASALEFEKGQRKARMAARELEGLEEKTLPAYNNLKVGSDAYVNEHFAYVNRGQRAVATHDKSQLVAKTLPLGVEGPIQYERGARSTFELQNRRKQGSAGLHSYTFPEFKMVGDVEIPKRGIPQLSPVERAQNEVIANYSGTSKGLEGAASDKSGPLGFEEAYAAASKATDKDRLTRSRYQSNLDAGMSEKEMFAKAQNDYRYERRLRSGAEGYDPKGALNREIDAAFDGPVQNVQKSNGPVNKVSSSNAGSGDVTPGDMGYAGFSGAMERHGAGAVLGIGATYMSEGEVTAGGTVRGAMFGVAGGKAARMFTGSMRGGAVNSMARGVGDSLSAAGEGTMRKTAGDFISGAMNGMDAAKSQQAMRMATFAGAGLAGFSMGRDRNHSRGMNGSRGSRF